MTVLALKFGGFLRVPPLGQVSQVKEIEQTDKHK